MTFTADHAVFVTLAEIGGASVTFSSELGEGDRGTAPRTWEFISFWYIVVFDGTDAWPPRLRSAPMGGNVSFVAIAGGQPKRDRPATPRAAEPRPRRKPPQPERFTAKRT